MRMVTALPGPGREYGPFCIHVIVALVPQVQAKLRMVVGAGDLDRSQVAVGLVFEERV